MKLRILFLSLTLTLVSIAGCNEENSPTLYSLTISVTPDNSGTVIPSDELTLVEGEDLQLLAIPEEGYTFINWEGNLSSTFNPLSVTIADDMDITANFQLKTYPLNITIVGNGSVVETLAVEKSTDYGHGALVALDAVADNNWVFIGWSGDLTGTNPQESVIVTEEMNITATFEFEPIDPVSVQKTNDAKIYMHYMPWFTSGPYDGSWSSHWTMANRNPETIVDGQRQIASHYYPLIGPYSSKDPDLAEYHLLLMKYSGIDAVLIDWYGTYDVYDYRDNLEGSNNIIDKVDDVGLNFGIIYEDRTTANVVNFGLANSKIEAATTDFQYIFDNYFSSDAYVTVNNTPVAGVFTPIEIETGSSWNTILSNAPTNPLFLSLWGERSDLGTEGDGEYAWVYNADGNHLQLLRNFNGRIGAMTLGIGSAYPGFVDFYEEGGYGDYIGWEIAHNGTSTLDATLGIASQYNIDHLQLVTWNDFGEGTMLEPTVEFGYEFLTTIQEFTGVSYGQSELELIKQLYDFRKEYADNSEVQDKLNQVFYLLVSLQVEEARALMEEL